MFITFLRSMVSVPQRETPRVGHQFNIFDYAKRQAAEISKPTSQFDLFEFLRFTARAEEAQAMEEKKEETVTQIASTLSNMSPTSRLTVMRSKESLRNFFNYHKKPEWTVLPPLPSFSIEDIGQHYRSFKIPKKEKGKWRDIDAPDEELSRFLDSMKSYLENTLQILTHDVAHAYVKQRSNRTAVATHQVNDSHFFLKLDMKNFFPAHNMDYIMSILSQIYPIGFLLDDENYKQEFTKRLAYAFYRDVLPQGTPLSPTLTNICMVPLDFTLKKKLKEKGPFVYTRYADDILISSKYNFRFTEVQEIVKGVLAEYKAPFYINEKKTRYGSRAGSNWNLGMMLNKDNRITMGHKANKRLKAILFNIFADYQNGRHWSPKDAQIIQGNINYSRQIDAETTDHIIQTYENKFGLSLKRVLKEWINGQK